MKYMMIVKATEASEAGVMPCQELLEAMGKFNQEMADAGVMLAGEGLAATSQGARVHFSGDKRTVIDGPFAETKELIAGYWIIRVNSKEEAIEWARRSPNPAGPGGDTTIELRRIFEAEDFGAEFTPEDQTREEDLRRQIAGTAA
jgi:hypothetical protein